MWTQIKIPYITERIIGFSLPVQNQIMVFDADGLFLVDSTPHALPKNPA